MIALVIEKKLRKLGKFDSAKVRTKGEQIIEWVVDGVPQPSDSDLQVWASEISSEENAEKQNTKNAKKALMTKLGLNKAELKALIALIRDGSED